MEKLFGSDVFIGLIVIFFSAYMWLRTFYVNNGIRRNMAVVFWIGWAILFIGLGMKTLGIISMSLALLLLVMAFINWHRTQQQQPVSPRLEVKNSDPDFNDPSIPRK